MTPDTRLLREHSSAFMDGLIGGADEDTSITDGYEQSYYYKTARHFAHGRDVVRYMCRGGVFNDNKSPFWF